MSGLEIRVNSGTIHNELTDIRNAENELKINKLGSHSSVSAALDEFVSVYTAFSTLIERYKEILEKDLGSVSSAAEKMDSVDKLEGEGILGINASTKNKK